MVFDEPETVEFVVNKGIPVGFRKIAVPAPALWSAETPNLYRLTVTLLDPEKRVVEATGATSASSRSSSRAATSS